jgi:hypothetical protein
MLSQYSVIHILPSVQAAGTLVHIETENGDDVLTFAPGKEYQSIVFSSADLANGLTYWVFSGGSSTGTETEGLFTDGVYSAGSQVASFTISSMVTGEGIMGGGFPGGPGGIAHPDPNEIFQLTPAIMV